jgi:hypothetical protein
MRKHTDDEGPGQYGGFEKSQQDVRTDVDIERPEATRRFPESDFFVAALVSQRPLAKV